MTRQELEKLVEEEATKYRGTVIVQNAPSPIYREYVGDLCRESYESSGKFVMDKLFPVISELHQENRRLRETLTFFADKRNYTEWSGIGDTEKNTYIIEYGLEKARQALSGEGSGE